MIEESEIREFFRQCLRIREAENQMAEHYLREKIFSFVHFSSGQELAPVAVSSRLQATDRVFGNHRSHAHYLARGGNLLTMFLEMLGSEEGCSGGFGGSMHLRDLENGFWGSSPVLGSIAPIAAGSAFQQHLNPENTDLTVCYIGDGASEEGVVAETLNLISLWRLPLLLVIEDNFYAVNSPSSARRPEGFNFGQLAEAYQVKAFKAQRGDALSHARACIEAVEHVRHHQEPAVLVAESYRNFAHSSPLTDDHLGYREMDSERDRASNDHLRMLRTALVDLGVQDSVLERDYSDLVKEISDVLMEAASQAPRSSESNGGLQ